MDKRLLPLFYIIGTYRCNENPKFIMPSEIPTPQPLTYVLYLGIYWEIFRFILSIPLFHSPIANNCIFQ